MFYCPTPQNSQDFQSPDPLFYIFLLHYIILRSVKSRASRGTLFRSSHREAAHQGVRPLCLFLRMKLIYWHSLFIGFL